MINGREVSIEIKTNPTIITSQTDKKLEIQFRLYLRDSNVTISHITYLIRIAKGFADPNAPPVLSDYFHSHNGTLILKIDPPASAEENVYIEAKREPVLNSWLADEKGMIELRAPFFSNAAPYHIQVEILTVDLDRNVLGPQEIPKFDEWIIVSEGTSKTVKLDNQLYNSTVVSYFDRIDNFALDEDGSAFSWSIPFDWNETIMQNEQPLFVHQHLMIPKTLFNVSFGEDMSNSNTRINATMNGLVLNGSSFVIDPYSYEDEIVFHILINKQKMLDFAEIMPVEARSKMMFVVSQNSNVVPEFGIGILSAVAAITGMVIVISRYKKLGI